MDVADVIPIQVSMPTPAQPEHTEASAHVANSEEQADYEPHTPPNENQGSPSAISAAHESFAAAPSPPAPTAKPQPSPARSTEAPSFYILQLRSQLQRIEAR
ncbi:hypothetical protein V6N13_023136 [Hibiscus sabdariffa]